MTCFTILGTAINYHNRETNHAWIVKTALDEGFADGICEELNQISDEIQVIEHALEQLHNRHPRRKPLEIELARLLEHLRNLDTRVVFLGDCDIHYEVFENPLISPK